MAENNKLAAIQYINMMISRLQSRGWCQGAMRDAQGRCCLLGSTDLATDGYVTFTSSDPMVIVMLGIALVIGKQLPSSFKNKIVDIPVAEWNDAYCKSQEEAVAMLRQAKTLIGDYA